MFPQVIGTLRATDKDDQPASFTFILASPSSNFSIRDFGSKLPLVFFVSRAHLRALKPICGTQ